MPSSQGENMIHVWRQTVNLKHSPYHYFSAVFSSKQSSCSGRGTESSILEPSKSSLTIFQLFQRRANFLQEERVQPVLSVGHAWACPKSTTALFPGRGFLASLPESKAKYYKYCAIQCVIAIVSGRIKPLSSSMGPQVWYWGKRQWDRAAFQLVLSLTSLGSRGHPTNTQLGNLECYDSFYFGCAQQRPFLAQEGIPFQVPVFTTQPSAPLTEQAVSSHRHSCGLSRLEPLHPSLIISWGQFVIKIHCTLPCRQCERVCL